MDNLWHIGLLTLVERYDALRSDFDTEDKVLLLQAIIEAEALEEAGFTEFIPTKPN